MHAIACCYLKTNESILGLVGAGCMGFSIFPWVLKCGEVDRKGIKVRGLIKECNIRNYAANSNRANKDNPSSATRTKHSRRKRTGTARLGQELDYLTICVAKFRLRLLRE
jgi:hypothetical protein